MIAMVAMSLKLGGRVYTMRPGQPVPAPVLAHWRATSTMGQMEKSGMVKDDKPQSKSGKPEKETTEDGPVRTSEARQ